MHFRVTAKVPSKASNSATNRLTNPFKYSSVFYNTTGYRANHVECANTPHGSNPTLIWPVNGLHSIIQPRMILVLRWFGSPPDSLVGVGCLVFRAERG